MKRWTDDDPPPPVAPHSSAKVARTKYRSFLAGRPVLKFCWQTVKATALIVAVMAALTQFPRPDVGAAWLLVYSLPLILGAIVWFFIWLSRRYGGSAVLSVFSAIAILSAVQYVVMRHDAARASLVEFDHRSTVRTDVAVIDLSELRRECDEPCMAVLSQSNYRVMIGGRMFRLESGDICHTPPHRASHLFFLKTGYASSCVAEESGGDRSQILIVNQVRCHGWENRSHDPACAGLPSSFGGKVTTIRVRSGTREHVTARWLEGAVHPYSGLFALVGLEHLFVREWEDVDRTLSRAIGTEIRFYRVTGTGDLDVVLSELRTYLAGSEQSYFLYTSFGDISVARGRDNQEALARHVRELLVSDQPAYLAAGLALITPQSEVEVSDSRTRIAALANSSDDVVRNLARKALSYIDRH
jgi:hypothetical protein